MKKKNGEEYEPGSLTSYQRSIDRYLRDAGREFSILTDREFEGSRRALEVKRKDLKEKEKEGDKMQQKHSQKGMKSVCGSQDSWEMTIRTL